MNPQPNAPAPQKGQGLQNTLNTAGMILDTGTKVGNFFRSIFGGQRKFNREQQAQIMAENRQMQRDDYVYNRAKQDEIDFWNMQNSYNSPQAQIARLQEAGLNPNLVYGSGAVANSTSAPNVPGSAPLRTAAPKFDIPNIVDGWMDLALKHQTLSNTKKIGDNIVIDGMSKILDVQAKDLFNRYMNEKGYEYRGKKEQLQGDYLYESMLQKLLENAFNTGKGFNEDLFKEGGGYFLKREASKNLNELRRAEMQGKGHDNRYRKMKADQGERLMSGDFGDMSFKDMLMFIMQLIK